MLLFKFQVIHEAENGWGPKAYKDGFQLLALKETNLGYHDNWKNDQKQYDIHPAQPLHKIFEHSYSIRLKIEIKTGLC